MQVTTWSGITDHYKEANIGKARNEIESPEPIINCLARLASGRVNINIVHRSNLSGEIVAIDAIMSYEA